MSDHEFGWIRPDDPAAAHLGWHADCSCGERVAGAGPEEVRAAMVTHKASVPVGVP